MIHEKLMKNNFDMMKNNFDTDILNLHQDRLCIPTRK